MNLARPSAIALILANLVPLAGVVWLEWRVFDVLMLYWAENVVIGCVNVLRMLTCWAGLRRARPPHTAVDAKLTDAQRQRVSRDSRSSRFFLIPFFALHYGMFCFGHYIAVMALFGDESGNSLSGEQFLEMPVSEMWHAPLWIGVAAIAVSHLLSFVVNFIGGGEYQRTSLTELMRRPYGRIVVLHISVIAGGFLVSTLGDPVWMLLMLIVMKSAIDLRMHERERKVFSPAATARGGTSRAVQ